MLPLGAVPANAYPTNCYANQGGVIQYAHASCSGGTGQFRVWVQCRGWSWPNYSYFVNGYWARPGVPSASMAFCPAYSGVVRYGVERIN